MFVCLASKSLTMFHLSPNIFSPAIEWQFEESTALHHDDLYANYTIKENNITSLNSISSSSTDQLPDFEYHDDLHNSTLAIKDSTKKSSHNEYERHRRKKLNSLYSSLRSLLPGTDHSKNLSIPCTVGLVTKYIPELRKRIERLERRKEEIILRKSKERSLTSTHVSHDKKGVLYPVISATCLNKREVMIQLCIFSKGATVLLSKIVKILEEERLQLMTASTLINHIADKTFCSLHLQAKEAIGMECSIFCENLMSLLGGQAKSSIDKL